MIEYLLAFIIFSFYIALLSSFFKFIFIIIKLYNTSEEEYLKFRKFKEHTFIIIAHKNNLSTILTNKLLYFLPGYALMMNIAFIYYAILYPGILGVVKGMLECDKLSFIPLIRS